MHRYEKKAEYPSVQKIVELAQALDMSVDDLLRIDNNGHDSCKNINPKLAKRFKISV